MYWPLISLKEAVHLKHANACMRSQSYITLCDPMDCSPPGSSVCGIFQARILQWVAISSSREPFPPRDQTCISSASCIAGRFFTAEPLGKPQNMLMQKLNNMHPAALKWLGLLRYLYYLTPWTAAYQAPPSMGFSRQEYWSGSPLPSPNLHYTVR